MKRLTAVCLSLFLIVAVAAIAGPRSFFEVLVVDPGLKAGTPEYDVAYAKALKAARDVKAAKVLKSEADALQDAGSAEEASAKYAEAAKVHPQSQCRAALLFSAGAALVSKPGRPFMYDVGKCESNARASEFYKQAALALSDPDPYGCGATEASYVASCLNNAEKQIALNPCDK